MPRFGRESLANLETADRRLQTLMHEAIRKRDCKITCGHRNESDQNAAFARGASGVRWPDGNHNDEPARAVDAPVYPVRWGGRVAIGGSLRKERVDELLENRYQAGFARGCLDLGGKALVWNGHDQDLVSGADAKVHRENLHALVRFYDFGGYVLGVAARLEIPIRWGGDWDRDHDVFDDQRFQDLVHFELGREAP